MRSLTKSTLREIGNSAGRYLALLMILALGVGFFAGLRACRPAFISMAGKYFKAQNLYDYRLLSSLGFSKDSVEELSQHADIDHAEGAMYEDVLMSVDESDWVFRVHSVTGDVDRLALVSGRLPEFPWECVLDADVFDEELIGKTLPFSQNNKEETLDAFNESGFLVVGTVRSPLYISHDRGSTSIGDGRVAAFAFVNEDAFTANYYTELYVTLANRAEAYSQEYEDLLAVREDDMTELAVELAQRRYEEILSTGRDEIEQARAELDEAQAELDKQKEAAVEEMANQMAAYGLSVTKGSSAYEKIRENIDTAFQDFEDELTQGYEDIAEAEAELRDVEPPSSYVLTRDENVGYVSLKQDATIIENISVVFPAFFFLVAALVCTTTMMRMVDEQRTQIGVWKALGYRRNQICCKYLFYAGSAGLIGGLGGFLVGTAFIPKVFWIAYSSVYNIPNSLSYIFDAPMLVLSLSVDMLCTVGVTWVCCRKTLREVPAAILRPKAPKKGKRILLESVTSVWRRLSFLYKVSLRNVFRYKQRFFLMILGIGGCAALVLTGFGIRDSIQNVSAYQYGEIVLYDGEISFTDPLNPEQRAEFARKYAGTVKSLLFLAENNAQLQAADGSKEMKLSCVSEGNLGNFLNLHTAGESVLYPRDGELILSRGNAGTLNLEVGDTVTLTSSAFYSVPVTVTGIFDNYIGNYAFVSENTMESLFGQVEINAAYVLFPDGVDQGQASAVIAGDEIVGQVTLNRDTQQTIDASFASLDLIVLLIILFAGALAFIVLFNLININISERNREIATLRVLGFFHRESAAYVFREINMLTVAGTLLGLLLGRYLHAFVMAQIKSDGVCFDNRIALASYFLSFVMTLFFAALVKLVMSRKLKRIHMAEALKTVE